MYNMPHPLWRPVCMQTEYIPIHSFFPSFLVRRFLGIVEQAPGAVAVHCKGLPLQDDTHWHKAYMDLCNCQPRTSHIGTWVLRFWSAFPLSWPGTHRNSNCLLHHEALPLYSCWKHCMVQVWKCAWVSSWCYLQCIGVVTGLFYWFCVGSAALDQSLVLSSTFWKSEWRG